MPECVIDTVILQSANAPMTKEPRSGRLIERRIGLLKEISAGTIRILISRRLMNEYQGRLPSPRNEYIKAFFALLDRPDRVTWNWKKRWSGGERATAAACRYPIEDVHLLRTAIRDGDSRIYTEEGRLLDVDECIFRQFRVHISALP